MEKTSVVVKGYMCGCGGPGGWEGGVTIKDSKRELLIGINRTVLYLDCDGGTQI